MKMLNSYKILMFCNKDDIPNILKLPMKIQAHHNEQVLWEVPHLTKRKSFDL